VREVTERLRYQLAVSSGIKGLRGLSSALRRMDWNGSGELDLEEFKSVIHSIGLKCSDQDVKLMHAAFDVRRTGSMSYMEFLHGVRGEMTVRRLLVVDRAYEKLDVNGDGNIDVKDSIARYNPSSHPMVQEGRMSEDEAVQEFADVMASVRGSSSGIMTQDDFRAYYAEVSATTDNDQAFVQTVCQAWGVVEAGGTNTRLETVINQCRSYCTQKGLRCKQFFTDFDSLNCGLITEAQFLRCTKASCLPVTPDEIQLILEAYRCTKNRAAMVKYAIFCNRIDGLEAAHEKMETMPRSIPKEIPPSPLTEKRRALPDDAEGYVDELLEYLKYMCRENGWIFKTYYKDFDRHNLGKVTPQQFRRNFPLELSEDQFLFLELKYQDPVFGDINYRALHDDITDPLTLENQLDYKENPLARRPAETDSRMVDEVELRLQNKCFQQRIRLKDFFTDFDRLRTGLCTHSQFKRALIGACGIGGISQHEVDVLVEEYTDRNDVLQRVQWRRFTDNMDNVFVKQGLEKRPRTPVPAPHQWQMDDFGEANPFLTEQEQGVFVGTMDMITSAVSQQRMTLKPFFENFDKNHMEEVSGEQFTRAIIMTNINVSEEEQRILKKAYHNPMRKRMIRYGAFWEDIKKMLPQLPAHLQSAPISYVNTLAKDPLDPDPEPPKSKGGEVTSGRRANKAPKVTMNDIDLEGLMDKLRSRVLVRKLRINDFFKEFDRLRSGYCSKPQFRTAMSIADMGLTEPELGLLEETYSHPNAQDKMAWKDFTEGLLLVFNQRGLEKNPLTDGQLTYVPGTESLNPAYVPTKTVTQREITPEEDARINDVLDRFAAMCSVKRIVSAYDQFQMFDKLRSGKVTKSRFFRRLKSLEFDYDPLDEEALCLRYLDIGGMFNYMMFADDAQPDRVGPIGGPGAEGSPPLSTITPWESQVRPPPTPDVDVDQLLDVMRAHTVRERVRLYDALQAHDKLRRGRIASIKFRGVLDVLGFRLTVKEMRSLEERFAVPGTFNQEINYPPLVEAMESSFTQNNLERDPMIKVKTFQPMQPSDEVQLLPTEDDEVFTDTFMADIARDFALRRIQPKTFFRQYDRCHIGSVTDAQFQAVLKNLGCPLSEEEFQMLKMRYHKGDRKVVGDIGYIKFCKDLEALVENPPIETSFGPGTDGPK